eukprot:UN03518
MKLIDNDIQEINWLDFFSECKLHDLGTKFNSMVNENGHRSEFCLNDPTRLNLFLEGFHDYTPNKTESRSILSQVMLPSDCSTLGTVWGGVIMKLMDNGSGVSST